VGSFEYSPPSGQTFAGPRSLLASEAGAFDAASSGRVGSVAAAESINATLSIHEALLTREERMASRADVDRELLPRRTRLESASAGAGGSGGLVFGVNAVLHGSLSIRWGSAGAGEGGT